MEKQLRFNINYLCNTSKKPYFKSPTLVAEMKSITTKFDLVNLSK